MLVSLRIRNLAVIEFVEVAFDKGFHVLTGETGAGKSMIVDALSLIAGGRGSQDLIRHGTDKAEVEGYFEPDVHHPVWKKCEELGIEVDVSEGLIIRREITSAGKSVARVNGQLVNLSMLKQVGEFLINIHGQHEHQSLLKTDHHLGLLDTFAKDELSSVIMRYQDLFRSYKSMEKRLRTSKENRMKQLQLVDLYRFQLAEIDAAQLVANEDEKLEEERMKLANAEKLYQSINQGYEAIYENQAALFKLNKAIQSIEQVMKYDLSTLQPLKEQLDTAYFQVEDAAFQLRDYREDIAFNPEQLNRVEQRLDTIHGLRKKYGDSVTSIIEYGIKIRSALQELEDFDQSFERQQQELEQMQEQLNVLANQLSDIRSQASLQLTEQINQQLRELQMEKATLEVRLGKKAQIDESGQDDAEFMFSANPGEPLKSLAKIASGGELSRVMLALKTIFATIEQIPVLIFDEVDTGVSGRAAQAIAEKLAWIANSCQVFSITHLPQVACMADIHFLIQKSLENERTFTDVQSLIGQARTQELARMLGGVEVTATTLIHADEMLQLAVNKKQQWQ